MFWHKSHARCENCLGAVLPWEKGERILETFITLVSSLGQGGLTFIFVQLVGLKVLRYLYWTAMIRSSPLLLTLNASVNVQTRPVFQIRMNISTTFTSCSHA